MKTLLLLVCLLYSVSYIGQSKNIDIVRPTPSAAGLSTYNTMPVSIQTGVPDISYPLINIETGNKSANISLGLSYHAGNASNDNWVSEVGQGWSFLGTGIISREIDGDFDEVFDDNTLQHYIKNEFDDIYNFNIPGESGKFRFIRDIENNTFKLIKLTPFTSKIEYKRPDNPATLIVDSFTITSESGIQYVFNDYDLNMMNVWKKNHPLNGPMYADKQYRSAFYISSILDENGQELVKYTYLRDMKYPPGVNEQATITETNKLTRITIKDHGIIEINYNKNEEYSKYNDIFSINNIVLKTSSNIFIKKYIFNYSYLSPYLGSIDPQELRRSLNSFSQVDQNGKTIQKYEFTYDQVLFLDKNNQLQKSNISELNKIKLPTGGIIEYIFDFPMGYVERRVTVPVPKVHLTDISFTKVNGPRKYAFTLTENKTLEIDASGIGQISSYLWALQFWKKNGDTYSVSHAMGQPTDQNPDLEYVQKRAFEPGEYYLDLYCNDLSCSNLNLSDPAVVQIWRDGDGEPTETIIREYTIIGPPRIKNIKYYNADIVNIINTPVPVKVDEYEYDKFDDPGSSSGYSLLPSMIYKNIKVIQGGNNGYTKYYFKAPDAYLWQNGLWPNYNLTRGGLIDKKEVYNALNQKLSEDLFEYTIEEYDGPAYKLDQFIETKTSWIKDSKVVSRNYFDSGMVETKNEIFRNTHNNKPKLERSTSFDGSIQETAYQYALEKNNLKLLGANIVGIPLEITSTIKKNISDPGKLISRSETKYENPGHKYPTSSVSYDSQDLLASEVIFNRYDSKGNLEQYTTKDGIPVSVVWGYNKTQPIAKVEGASYDQIVPYISDIISKSDAAVISEADLQNALDAFRNNTNFGNYQITTYLFDSLARMKTMTPPTGVRAVYQYDSAGRLEKVEDEAGKLLKKYQYNYGH